jgi:DNA-binding MarR family transcriptional regulator
MQTAATEVVRRFNRSYTQRIGALDESFLGMGMSLGASRLLFEIGLEPGTVQALRGRLGLDSGYVSRLLRSLEENGLVSVRPDPEDRRRRLVELTAKGRAAHQRLEGRSEERARLLLEPLSARQQERLVESLRTADLLVRAATVAFVTVPADSTAARTATSAYFAELDRRFPDGFDAGDQSAHDVELMSPPRGAFVIATSDGEPVACGGVQGLEEGVGEIKRMWVHEGWRGAGLGARLLSQLERTAVSLGHRVIRLDTNDTLREAIALYERAGYRRVAAYNDNPHARLWFEKSAVGEV